MMFPFLIIKWTDEGIEVNLTLGGWLFLACSVVALSG
jgi:hypothetical protein